MAGPPKVFRPDQLQPPHPPPSRNLHPHSPFLPPGWWRHQVDRATTKSCKCTVHNIQIQKIQIPKIQIQIQTSPSPMGIPHPPLLPPGWWQHHPVDRAATKQSKSCKCTVQRTQNRNTKNTRIRNTKNTKVQKYKYKHPYSHSPLLAPGWWLHHLQTEPPPNCSHKKLSKV